MTETSQQIASQLGSALQRGLQDYHRCCTGADAAKGEPVLLKLVVGSIALAAWFEWDDGLDLQGEQQADTGAIPETAVTFNAAQPVCFEWVLGLSHAIKP
jgi:hypothetical protein